MNRKCRSPARNYFNSVDIIIFKLFYLVQYRKKCIIAFSLPEFKIRVINMANVNVKTYRNQHWRINDSFEEPGSFFSGCYTGTVHAVIYIEPYMRFKSCFPGNI